MSEPDERVQSIVILLAAVRKVVDSCTVDGDHAQVPKEVMNVLEVALLNVDKQLGLTAGKE